MYATTIDERQGGDPHDDTQRPVGAERLSEPELIAYGGPTPDFYFSDLALLDLHDPCTSLVGVREVRRPVELPPRE
jgi:hypothetical protein